MGPMPRHCRTVKNHGPKALLAHNLFVCGCLGSWPISGPKDPSSKFFFKNKSGTVQYQKFKTFPELVNHPYNDSTFRQLVNHLFGYAVLLEFLKAREFDPNK